jgi:hypothetical protein
MHPEVGPAGQVARFMNNLDDQWRETLQSIFTVEMQTLGTVRGNPAIAVDPISSLVHLLHEHFGRIGDTQILDVMQQRSSFARLPNETFEMTVIRFETLRRKCRELSGENLNHMLESSDLMNIMKITGQDRLDALRPFGGTVPTDAIQYEALKTHLRFTIQERQRRPSMAPDHRRHFAVEADDGATYYRMDYDDTVEQGYQIHDPNICDPQSSPDDFRDHYPPNTVTLPVRNNISRTDTVASTQSETMQTTKVVLIPTPRRITARMMTPPQTRQRVQNRSTQPTLVPRRSGAGM